MGKIQEDRSHSHPRISTALLYIRTQGDSLKVRPGWLDVRSRVEEDPEKKSPEEEREGEGAG